MHVIVCFLDMHKWDWSHGEAFKSVVLCHLRFRIRNLGLPWRNHWRSTRQDLSKKKNQPTRVMVSTSMLNTVKYTALLDSHWVMFYLLIYLTALFSFRSADAGGREGERLSALGGVQSVHPGFRRVVRLPLHPGPLCSQCGQHSLQQLVAQLLDQTGQRGKRPWAVWSKGKAERLQFHETRVEVFKYFMCFWPLPVFFFFFFLSRAVTVSVSSNHKWSQII